MFLKVLELGFDMLAPAIRSETSWQILGWRASQCCRSPSVNLKKYILQFRQIHSEILGGWARQGVYNVACHRWPLPQQAVNQSPKGNASTTSEVAEQIYNLFFPPHQTYPNSPNLPNSPQLILSHPNLLNSNNLKVHRNLSIKCKHSQFLRCFILWTICWFVLRNQGPSDNHW